MNSSTSTIDRATTVGLTVLLTVSLATPAVAESDEEASEQVPPGTTERTVLGWTDDEKVIVRRTSRGERMVSGRSEDFYFKLTELRDAASGELVEAARFGELSGASHPAWEAASPVSSVDGSMGADDRHEAVGQWHSPDGRVALTTVARTTTETIEGTRRGTQYRCVHHQRLVAIGEGWDRVAVLEEWTEKGNPAMRRDGASCPEVALEVFWHPESSHWAGVRTVTLSGGQVRAPSVVAGTVPDQAASSGASVRHRDRLLADWVASLPGDELQAGYRALHDGKWDEAREAFAAVSDSDDERTAGFAAAGLARVAARAGDGDEVEAQLDRMKETLDDPFWETAVAAGCYRRIGDMEQSELELGRAREHASSATQWIRLGELFRFYDLEVANRALTEALRRDDLDKGAEPRQDAYGLLIEGLIEAGHYDKAATLFEELSSPPPGMRARQIRADFERAAFGEADPGDLTDRTASLLYDHAGTCAAYLLEGRVAVRQRRLPEARRQFQVARRCDATEPATDFYLGAIDVRTGDWSAAERHLRRYLERAVDRRGDRHRDGRRRLAESYLERIAHSGAVLTTLECEPRSMGGILCHGVVENTTDDAIENIAVRATRRQEEGRVQQTSTSIAEIEAEGSRTFGLRLEEVDVGDLVFEAGRSEKEFELNRTPAVVR